MRGRERESKRKKEKDHLYKSYNEYILHRYVFIYMPFYLRA